MLGVVVPIVAALFVLAFLVDLPAAPESTAVGDIRAIVARSGANLRETPSALARPAAALPHAAQVRVEEIRGPWLRVTPLPRAGAAAQLGGWIRASRTVQPFALTTAGRGAARSGRTTGGLSSTEISAAGRQFDDATEDGYRQSSADLQRAYPLVDRIEEAKPDEETIRLFIVEGRLGRPEEAR
jgi:hypothetical protein